MDIARDKRWQRADFLPVLVLFFLIFIEAAFAQKPTAETAVNAITHTVQLNLPACLKSESTIAQIQFVQKANAKSPFKYDGYRTVLHAESALELVARLTYAETLAANCPAQQDQILDLIASVIGNRIRIRRGDVNSVIFQKDQFASSLNMYSESRYRDFLCPNDTALWAKAVTKARVNLDELKPSAPIPNDAVNYYLYQHSERFKAPAWTLDEVPIADTKTRECIRVFRDPSWK